MNMRANSLSNFRKRCRLRPYLQALETRIAPAVFYVDDLTDDDVGNPKPGTLRYAVNEANNTPNSGNLPDDIIIIRMGMIPMSAPLTIGESVVIDPFGASEVSIDFSKMTTGGPGFKICPEQAGTGAVTFVGLTITGTKNGPAIFAMDRDVVIRDCEITGNTNSGPGGGVYFTSKGVNQLTIERSTIAQNFSGGDGGGVFVKGNGPDSELVVVHNSTISTNTAKGNGGGLAVGGLTGLVVMRFATITANTADGTNSKGGGVSLGDNGMTIVSSIISGNTNSGAVSSPDIYAAVAVDRLYSAVGSPNGFITGTNTANLAFGTNLMLGGLPQTINSTVNGGETRTHALQAGSPAIDAGFNQFPALFFNDQRGPGFARSVGQTADIGAYESSDIPFAHSKRMDVSTSGATTFAVMVVYTDDIAINVGSVGVNDLQVTGPNGFTTSTALSVSLDVPANGTPRIATYTYAAPGGSWGVTDNGTYTTTLLANQVFDVDAVVHAVPTGSLGDFYVGIAIVVNELGDATVANGKTSIREAIALANTIVSGPTGKNGVATPIVFDPTVFNVPTMIQITPANGGELLITVPVTILGPAPRLTLSGGNTNRIFNINVNNALFTDPSLRLVTISDLTLTAGTIAGTGGAVFVQDDLVTINDSTINNNKASINGGGIGTGNGGSVSLIRTTVDGNTATNGGGGVFVSGSGTLNVDSSTISGNTATNQDGGGVYMFQSSSINSSIVNSTISGNSGRRGGGIFLGQWQAAGQLKIYNSTITNNKANTIPDGGGILVSGDVNNKSGTLTLNSTILAANIGSNGPDLQFLAPLANQPVAGNNNLVGVANVGNFTLTGTGNLTGTLAAPLNPQLGPLANNGGPTLTHALLPGSVATNAGNNALCLERDQRGFQLDPNFQLSIGSFGTNIVATQAQVVTVAINSKLLTPVDKAQRSYVSDVAITFDSTVTFTGTAAAAFALDKVGGGSVTLAANVDNSGPGTVVTLTFIGGSVNATSLADGRYNLRVISAQITNGLAGGDFNFNQPAFPATLDPTKVFRIFGDYTGDGNVAANDFIQVRLALGNSSPPFQLFDFENDGAVAASDFIQFRLRFGGSI